MKTNPQLTCGKHLLLLPLGKCYETKSQENGPQVYPTTIGIKIRNSWSHKMPNNTSAHKPVTGWAGQISNSGTSRGRGAFNWLLASCPVLYLGTSALPPPHLENRSEDPQNERIPPASPPPSSRSISSFLNFTYYSINTIGDIMIHRNTDLTSYGFFKIIVA